MQRKYAIVTEATVGERGQVTIPKMIRDRYGLRKGMKLEFDVTPEGILIRRKDAEQDPVWEVFGALRKGIDVDQFIRELRDE